MSDPYRWPYVRIINKPKEEWVLGASGGAMPGYMTKVYVDGVDMSAAVSSVQVNAHCKDVVTAVIEVLPIHTEIEGAIPEIGPESRELLIRLGWSPPVVPE